MELKMVRLFCPSQMSITTPTTILLVFESTPTRLKVAASDSPIFVRTLPRSAEKASTCCAQVCALVRSRRKLRRRGSHAVGLVQAIGAGPTAYCWCGVVYCWMAQFLDEVQQNC